ncbi:MAG: pilus assembly protein PilM [Deltaproteobacteria bacterium]|nr:pilus assembly protein PilM [Deltaproteobacteria bacterium]
MSRTLGLDIGEQALRAALVHSAFRTLEVERYIEIPLVQARGDIARDVDLSDAVQGLLSLFSQTPDTVITALAGDQVSIKTVQIPTAAAKHITQVLPLELESVLPFAVEETIIDYQPIETKGGQMNLLVAAALRSRIAEYIKELERVGIEPREIGAGAAILDGLTPLIPELKKEGPFLIGDIGRCQTDLCILQNGKCRLARTLSIGSDMLPEKAEQLWRGFQRSAFSFRSSGAPAFARVYLAGRGARAEGIAPWLSGKLETEVEFLALPRVPNSDEEPRPEFARAVALAGRGLLRGKTINLRQNEFALKRSAGALLRHSTLLSLCALVMLFSVVFSIYAQRSLLTDEQAALQTKLTEVTKQIFGKSVLEASEVEKLMSNTSSTDPLPRFDAFNALDALSGIISQDIVHDITNLRIEIGDDKHEGRFEIKGTLGTIEQRDEVAAKLEAHECFNDVKKGRTTTARDKERINYQLEAVIQCPGEASTKSSKKARRTSD